MRCKSRHLMLFSLVAVATLIVSVEISSLWAQEESSAAAQLDLPLHERIKGDKTG